MLFQSPNICSALAVASIIFEFFFPAVLLLPKGQAALFGTVGGVAFHGGIELLMGLDFLSYWCPILLVFIAQPVWGASIGTSQDEGFLTVLRQGFAGEPLAVGLAIAYLAVQAAVSLTFRDLLGEEKLPFSCCPMFFFPRNLFSADPKLFCMSGANYRVAGNLDSSYVYAPVFAPPFELSEADLTKLQHPVLYFGTLTNIPDYLQYRVKEEWREKDFVLFSSFGDKVPEQLRERLKQVVIEVSSAQDSDAWQPAKLQRLTELNRESLALFEECCTMQTKKFAKQEAKND